MNKCNFCGCWQEKELKDQTDGETLRGLYFCQKCYDRVNNEQTIPPIIISEGSIRDKLRKKLIDSVEEGKEISRDQIREAINEHHKEVGEKNI